LIFRNNSFPHSRTIPVVNTIDCFDGELPLPLESIMRSPHVHALHRELTDADRPIRLRLSFEDGPLAARLLVKPLVAMAAELQFVTHHGGIRAIAHHGKFLLQSQHDDTDEQ